MTPTDRTRAERETEVPAPRIAEQLRAIERALEERHDAEFGWRRDEDARFADDFDRRP
jgi:hypothetical protein